VPHARKRRGRRAEGTLGYEPVGGRKMQTVIILVVVCGEGGEKDNEREGKVGKKDLIGQGS